MTPIHDEYLSSTVGGGADAVRDIGQFLGGFWEGLKMFGPGTNGNFTEPIVMGLISAARD